MTMTNAEWMIQQGHKFSDLIVRHKGPDEYNSFVVRLNGEKLDEFELGDGQAFCEFALKKWLDSEHVDPILDDAEKRYLAAVIRPFRDGIYKISKLCAVNGKHEFLLFIGEDLYHGFYLPDFEAGTMYKGMETGKKYTLDELGI